MPSPLAVQKHMDALIEADLQDFLSRSRISAAAPLLKVGRELSFLAPPTRTVIVHLAESDPPEYVARLVWIVLSIEESWILIPRHGSASQLGLTAPGHSVAAVAFGAGDRDSLCKYLHTREIALGSASADLYAVAGSGNTILTWDHHTADEGLVIQLRDISETSHLLVELNTLGAEFEVLYTDG